jgi:cytoplasmic iron level regulating protein YaaA (DUF328/UPF0246 family)
MIILIHTSKTMRPPVERAESAMTTPLLAAKANELGVYIQSLSVAEIKKTMHVSEKLAETTRDLFRGWTDQPMHQRAAIDSFLGDIYSGMQVGSWSEKDRQYANKHLRILSGLYGILRSFDGIYPYRLEMGYKLPDTKYKNLYTFWGEAIVKTLATAESIVDLSAVEYGKTITAFVDAERVITPRFLTINPKTHEPTFVVVHAKIARGAFASWMIRNQIEGVEALKEFNEIGYVYTPELSTPKIPVFVCQEFGGIGLSVRLT